MTKKACFCYLLSLLVVLGLISVEKSGRLVPREGSNSQHTTITSRKKNSKKISVITIQTPFEDASLETFRACQYRTGSSDR
jgi:hypothetical protein